MTIAVRTANKRLVNGIPFQTGTRPFVDVFAWEVTNVWTFSNVCDKELRVARIIVYFVPISNFYWSKRMRIRQRQVRLISCPVFFRFYWASFFVLCYLLSIGAVALLSCSFSANKQVLYLTKLYVIYFSVADILVCRWLKTTELKGKPNFPANVNKLWAWTQTIIVAPLNQGTITRHILTCLWEETRLVFAYHKYKLYYK